jgi:hypothetical protein
MKHKRIYFRKKGKAIAIEGKAKNKSLHIYTLGTAEKHLSKLLENADFFTEKKRIEILEKLRRIDIKKKKESKMD